MNRPALLHKPLAALVLIAAGLPAAANEGSASATLSIEGVIKPKPCNPQFDNGGKINFGSLDLSKLANGNAPIKVGERNVEFQVFCAQAAKVRVRVRDERPNTAIPSVSMLDERFHYGLGRNGENKVGSYHIKILAAGTAGNGDVVTMSASDDANGSWHAPADAYAASDRWLAWSHTGDHMPGAFKTFKMALAVQVHLPPIDQLNLGEDIRLDGASTFELKYE
ncbi:DUF1120 domain-containing protein [Herbaspirillum sp. alder98]|uniref:DUF1120 domain-containing protein n=1 Tax=Herbaspirillum sp. alder98 TaxID=2913096 RepID=UPI001CD82AB5|nr:DUF1120 domain-containing protein [Herbaspirillum sp. alder98]MCA1323942.1 DUF1120 domain-containing protein [Herbaspirillum sp. alder98]